VTGRTARDRPILLVGAAGQVGSALAPRLAGLGPVVRATRADADLERPDELRALVRRVEPRAIVNAAAYTAVDAAERDEDRCWRINTEAPAVLAEEAARAGAPIVHYSTNYVFDGEAGEPYSEQAPTSPLNVYGATKALGETAVAAGNPAHLILRTAGVYGATGRNFMLRMLALAGEREELQVVVDQFLAPTPATFLADATIAALQRILVTGSAEAVFGTYHVTCAGATSWYGFAERIFLLDPLRRERRAARLRPVTSDEYPVAARRPRNGVLDNEMFARRFGLALPDWSVGLERTLEEFASRS
jgi:dTDP-4-dehydrorhamnose reductase